MHGTRNEYRAGCRCTPCRAANAEYWQRWYLAHKAQKPLLGSRVRAVEAQRLLRLILRERYQKGRLAQALGRHHDLARLSQQSMISLRTFLKVRRFYRTYVLDPEARTHADDPDAPDCLA